MHVDVHPLHLLVPSVQTLAYSCVARDIYAHTCTHVHMYMYMYMYMLYMYMYMYMSSDPLMSYSC